MRLYICVGHGVVIVVCSPWYRPSSALHCFSSSLVSCSYVCNVCIAIERKQLKVLNIVQNTTVAMRSVPLVSIYCWVQNCRVLSFDLDVHRQNEEYGHVPRKEPLVNKVNYSLVDEVEHVLLLAVFCR